MSTRQFGYRGEEKLIDEFIAKCLEEGRTQTVVMTRLMRLYITSPKIIETKTKEDK